MTINNRHIIQLHLAVLLHGQNRKRTSAALPRNNYVPAIGAQVIPLSGLQRRANFFVLFVWEGLKGLNILKPSRLLSLHDF